MIRGLLLLWRTLSSKLIATSPPRWIIPKTGGLFLGKIEAHEIQTQDPNFQCLVVSGKYRFSQVIKTLATTFAFIALLGRPCLIKASFDHSLIHHKSF